MKKKISILIGLLFILLIFWGCEEDVVDPVVPASYITQVNSTGPGTVIPSGAVVALKGTLALTLTKDIGVVSKATLNDGTELPLKDGKYYVPVTANGTVNVEFEKTPKWYLAQKPWKFILEKNRLVSQSNWQETIYSTSKSYYVMTFSEDTVKYFRDDALKNQFASMKYKLYANNDSLDLGTGIHCKIVKLDEKDLWYDCRVIYQGSFTPPYNFDPSKDIMSEYVFGH